MDRMPLGLDELVEHWTVLGDDQGLIAGKRGPTRLGFALLLKFFTQYGRFPEGRSELPDEAVEFVARQVKVPASDLGFYEWSGGGSPKYHRAQIRRHFGFRECSVADQGKLTDWLAAHVANAERDRDKVRSELLRRCRAEQIEPPAPDRVTRIVQSALYKAEQAWFTVIASRIAAAGVTGSVIALVGADDGELSDTGGTDDEDEEDDGVVGDDEEDQDSVLALVKSVPGNVSLNSMLAEVRKLQAARAVGLPRGLFADVAPKVVSGWRTRAAVESPSHLRRRLGKSPQTTVTLPAALLWEREREVTDSLVDLLIATVHRIGARAEQRVTKELISAFQKVKGKENILFAIAEASLERPSDAVREVVYPAVRGGEATLRELVREYKTHGPAYRQSVQTTLKASYTGHYRAGLIELLGVLEFRSTNTAHQPVVRALDLIARYARAGNLTYYPAGESAPEHKGTAGEWADLVYRADKRGRRRVVRMVYEVATFQALREQLRCKEIWVVGAGRWRDPDEDLPKDFEERRAEHYASLRKPLDPAAFMAGLRQGMESELAALDDALPRLDWVDIAERRSGAIKLTPLDAAPEPRNLRRIKNEVARRWTAVPLIDVLKEAVLRTGCLQAVTAVTGTGHLAPRCSRSGSCSPSTPAGPTAGSSRSRRPRATGRTRSATSAAATSPRRPHGRSPSRSPTRRSRPATGACGARGRPRWHRTPRISAWDQNLFTEWHSRYGGRGILVYWHVERGSVVVHSQTLRASASEVHAMVEGAIRHGTAMNVEGNYVDSHGQSEIGFGITRLLNIDLLPRIKRINKVRLYRPAAGDPDAYSRLTPAMTRPIRWDIIADNYDQVIRYATAIREGTASTEAVLSRFTRSASHPAYQAMLEIGRAQRTIFVARYLRDRDLQREIEEGLNVVEAWNGANAVICYGRGGEISTNRHEEVEMTVLCLRVLQAALVYVNTLMLQDVLAEEEWAALLGPADRRGLTPLFWQHVRPYGEVRLDMQSRLTIGGAD
jgi:TnpA family transposase